MFYYYYFITKYLPSMNKDLLLNETKVAKDWLIECQDPAILTGLWSDYGYVKVSCKVTTVPLGLSEADQKSVLEG